MLSYLKNFWMMMKLSFTREFCLTCHKNGTYWSQSKHISQNEHFEIRLWNMKVFAFTSYWKNPALVLQTVDNEPVVFINDAFMKVDEDIQIFALNHEVGHLQFKHLENLQPNTLHCNVLHEVEADSFAVGVMVSLGYDEERITDTIKRLLPIDSVYYQERINCIPFAYEGAINQLKVV
jgi:hypothetical protein